MERRVLRKEDLQRFGRRGSERLTILRRYAWPTYLDGSTIRRPERTISPFTNGTVGPCARKRERHEVLRDLLLERERPDSVAMTEFFADGLKNLRVLLRSGYESLEPVNPKR
ncbi:hypothetical protein [Anaeromyxobacter oryzae]|uniref:Uncharacterized protein n=1 Tax=Anaeromyxobacter oryzae TaxID=2918170 RepID=A0ABN6MXT1_9BACT|nr:hypothetical protein [Anaeromyxobacter oryzae]BDG05750.1 hypothetical protein AMOR_47460 [Anaeromyxobacter oryzae]